MLNYKQENTDRLKIKIGCNLAQKNIFSTNGARLPRANEYMEDKATKYF